MGQLLADKEGHEGGGKRLKALIEGLEGAFPAQRIAQEYGDKIDDVIGPHAPTGQAHPLADGLEHAQVGEILRPQAHFAKPLGQGGNRERRGLDFDGRMCHTRHVCPPCLGSGKMFSLTMRHIFARLTSLAQRLVGFSLFYRLLAAISLRISWDKHMALRAAETDLTGVRSMLDDEGIQWVLSTGYINVWSRLHAAE